MSNNDNIKYHSYTMILPVYNEQARVKRVLEYYRTYATIIVVDNYSTDNTVEIVKAMGFEVLEYQNGGTIQTPEWFKYITSICPTEYLLLLSCSEFIPVELLGLFNDIAESKEYDLVSCIVDSYTGGEFIQLWGGRIKKLERKIERFFNIKALDCSRVKIHRPFEVVEANRILYLPRHEHYVIRHLRDSDSFTLIQKHLDYAKVEAYQMTENNEPFSVWRLLRLYVKELLRFIQIPVAQWNRIAVREIWARIAMHSMIYWICWDLKHNETVAQSRERSNLLWDRWTTFRDGADKAAK